MVFVHEIVYNNGINYAVFLLKKYNSCKSFT